MQSGAPTFGTPEPTLVSLAAGQLATQAFGDIDPRFVHGVGIGEPAERAGRGESCF
jgi:hypothetical protein